MNKALSKSRFVLGTRCKKALWYSTHTPEIADKPDAAAIKRMKSGTAIGKLAQQLFPLGIEVTENHFKIKEAAESTQRLISEGAPALFEATALIEDRILARADLLNRVDVSTWDIYEVKSTGKVKTEHTWDVAFQTWCFRKCGFDIRNSFLVTLNGKYVRNGALDINQLFKIHPMQIDEMLEDMDEKVEDLLNVTQASECPTIRVGSQCMDSYRCPFYGVCNKAVEYGIHEIPRISGRQIANLEDRGITMIADIPADMRFSEKQEPFIHAVKIGDTIIKIPLIRQYLRTLSEPVSFLDFEGFCPGVPPFDGMSPYAQSPFQFSLRIPNISYPYFEDNYFIPTHRGDSRKELLRLLLADLPDTGSIVVWSAGYETRILQDLAALYPEYERDLNSIIRRIWDLMEPFKEGYYIDKDFHGSHSLKKVLPVLTDLSYEGLAIQSGDKAAMLYEQFINEEITIEQWVAVRDDLIKYCGMDTQAMIEILKYLQEIAR
jgi:hypothetical protein